VAGGSGSGLECGLELLAAKQWPSAAERGRARPSSGLERRRPGVAAWRRLHGEEQRPRAAWSRAAAWGQSGGLERGSSENPKLERGSGEIGLGRR
jgi:hypothetical protein